MIDSRLWAMASVRKGWPTPFIQIIGPDGHPWELMAVWDKIRLDLSPLEVTKWQRASHLGKKRQKCQGQSHLCWLEVACWKWSWFWDVLWKSMWLESQSCLMNLSSFVTIHHRSNPSLHRRIYLLLIVIVILFVCFSHYNGTWKNICLYFCTGLSIVYECSLENSTVIYLSLSNPVYKLPHKTFWKRVRSMKK